jgi:hypothetical protein
MVEILECLKEIGKDFKNFLLCDMLNLHDDEEIHVSNSKTTYRCNRCYRIKYKLNIGK